MTCAKTFDKSGPICIEAWSPDPSKMPYLAHPALHGFQHPIRSSDGDKNDYGNHFIKHTMDAQKTASLQDEYDSSECVFLLHNTAAYF